jgi:hypothetical protein
VLLSFVLGLYASVESGEARVLPYWVRYRAEELYGWLHWDRYVGKYEKEVKR